MRIIGHDQKKQCIYYKCSRREKREEKGQKPHLQK